MSGGLSQLAVEVLCAADDCCPASCAVLLEKLWTEAQRFAGGCSADLVAGAASVVMGTQ